MRLLERLPEIRGQSYLFVNILGQRARLIMIVITAEEQEITATYEIDPPPTGNRQQRSLLRRAGQRKLFPARSPGGEDQEGDRGPELPGRDDVEE
jgi:hypothetical protein